MGIIGILWMSPVFQMVCLSRVRHFFLVVDLYFFPGQGLRLVNNSGPGLHNAGLFESKAQICTFPLVKKRIKISRAAMFRQKVNKAVLLQRKKRAAETPPLKYR